MSYFRDTLRSFFYLVFVMLIASLEKRNKNCCFYFSPQLILFIFASMKSGHSHFLLDKDNDGINHLLNLLASYFVHSTGNFFEYLNHSYLFVPLSRVSFLDFEESWISHRILHPRCFRTFALKPYSVVQKYHKLFRCSYVPNPESK